MGEPSAPLMEGPDRELRELELKLFSSRMESAEKSRHLLAVVDQLQERTMLLGLLERVAAAANEAASMAEAMEVVLAEVCRYVGSPAARGTAPHGAAESVESPVRILHVEDPSTLEGLDEVALEAALDRLGVGRRALETGEVQAGEIAEGQPIRAFPASGTGDGAIAALEIVRPDGLEEDPDWPEILAYLGAQLGVVLQRQRARETIDRQIHELERSNAELRMFSHVASHDLQEPLRSVVSNVQLIERWAGEDLDERARRPIEFAVEGATRMKALIEDLLEYSRADTRAERLEEVDCDAVFDQVRTALQAAIEETGAEVTADPLPTVRAARSRLEQVFQNLVSNALKFRRPDEPPRVHVSARREPGKWVFSVRDNGLGIDPGEAERIFRGFERLHSEPRYPGSGLGLAICRKVVERHGGEIWVESEPGEGSVFRFTLPLNPTPPTGSGIP